MGTDARAFLDEQIAALKEFKTMATFVYQRPLTWPIFARKKRDSLPRHIAEYVCSERDRALAALRKVDHLIVAAEPVYVPVPLSEGDFRTASEAIFEFLFSFRVLVTVTAGIEDPNLAIEQQDIETGLRKAFAEEGMPEWVIRPPAENLEQCVEFIQDEVNRSIEKLNRDYLEAQIRAASGSASTVQAIPVRADNADSKPDTEKKTFPIPENQDVLRLAKEIKRRKDEPGESKQSIAEQFTHGDITRANSLLRQLRRFPHLLD